MTDLLVPLLVLVALVAVAGLHLSWTAGRIDRLHARVEAARNALDAQLVRRAAAARALASHALAVGLLAEEGDALCAAATTALRSPPPTREGVENDLSRALHRALAALPGGADGPGRPEDPELARLLAELDVAASRVGLARVFHNEAVRDTRALRGGRVPRLFRLSGHAPVPTFFEIDDTPTPGAGPPAAPGR